MNTDRRTGFCVRPKVDRPDASPGQFQRIPAEHGIRHVVSRRKNPPTRGTLERRWYECDRHQGQFAAQREFIEWDNDQNPDARWLAMYKSPGEAFPRKIPRSSSGDSTYIRSPRSRERHARRRYSPEPPPFKYRN